MEILVSILSGLLAIATSVNLIGDVVLKNEIRSQVEEVETIAIRIDNAPNYQIFDGKVQRVRIATRDLKINPEVQFKVLEFDIDRIDFDLKEFLEGDLFLDLDEEIPTIRLRQLFQQPLKMATRIVFTQEQLDSILKSPTINAPLSERLTVILNNIEESNEEFVVSQFQLDLLDNERVALRMKIIDLEREDRGEIDVDLELGVRVVAGHSFKFFDPKVWIDGVPEPPETNSSIDPVIARPLTFKILEELGIKIRILQLNSSQDELEFAALIWIDEFAASALLEATIFLETIELFLDQ